MTSSARRVATRWGAVAGIAGILTTMTPESAPAAVELYKKSSLPVEQRVDDLLTRMTLEEKVSLCAGKAGDCTQPLERLGVPSLRVTDGPHGVGWGVKSTCFPVGVAMGASWNPDLIRRVGAALADEARAENRHVLLGPCINIHRTPLGGRNFESFSEDPHLAGRIAVAYVKGVQSRRVGTSVKHYALNNQEWERTTISVEIDERAMREIYLSAFEAAVKEADPWTVMGAYNKVRGAWCCENPYLLNQVLKKEFGFRGVLVSDWGATHSTVDSALAGLDLEMPGPGEHLNDRLLQAVRDGKVPETAVDDMARRILRVIFLAGLMDKPDPRFKGALGTTEHRALARELAAEAITLLKNEDAALPLDIGKVKSVAVIGPNAAEARLGGGGSSTVNPPYGVSPLEGIERKCADRVVVRYEAGGVGPMDLNPIPSGCLVPPDGRPGEKGLRGEYFDNMRLEGAPVMTRTDPQVDFNWGAGSPDGRIPPDRFSVRWTGKLVPVRSGMYELGMTTDDGFRLYLDGKLVVDQWVDQANQTGSVRIRLEEGRSYDLRAEYYENEGAAAARLGWIEETDPAMDLAVQAARECDVAIVCAGLSAHFEGEGVDRDNMELPGKQNELIRRVAAANHRTIVVLNSGTPLVMAEWLDQVAAVVQAWYPGMEGGHAIADILFGDVNPSGRLPVSFPKRLEDNPSHNHYPGRDGVVRYAEGIWVGYRYYDTKNVEPLFPFGHGLSYTTFEYSDLVVEKAAGGGKAGVSLKLKNTGERAGAEVVQVYVRDVTASVERPAKELKAFRKVFLAPGEEQAVTFALTERDLAFYDVERQRWTAEPGEFEILVGSSSRDIRLTGKHTLRGE